MKQKDTEKALKEAFMKLALEHPINEITIKEIAAEAHVNRTTFYLYFYSVYDVLNRLEEECLHEFRGIFRTFSLKDAEDPYDILYRFGQPLDANPLFGKFLTRSTLAETFTHSIKQTISDDLIARIAEEQQIPPERVRFAVRAAVSGIMDAYVDWCKDRRGVTLEELCEQLGSLFAESDEVFRQRIEKQNQRLHN